MKLNWRIFLAFAHDLAACAAAWLASFWLRFNLEIPAPYGELALETLLWVVPLHAALFVGFGLYRGIWRFASLPDLKRIIAAVAIAAVAVPTALLMLQIAVPRSVLIMSPAFLIMIMGGNRLAYRAWKERSLGALVPKQREPVFVIGAEEAAVNLIKELARSPQWRVVGVFDDDATKHGRQLHGVNVLGRVDDLAAWKQRHDGRHAIIAMPEASHGVRRRAVEMCRRAGLNVLTVPSFDDLMSGKVTVSQIRHVELDDLLGRDPVVLDTAGLNNWFSGRVVLVSGAGGSIGAELCRQIARYRPRQLILFELNEFALYSIEQEFGERFPALPVVCAIGDVKDATRVAQVLGAYRPSVIFHAAAYKHVPLMENENAWQAILNNVAGTRVMAQAAIARGVEKFVFVSTDKAVNPTNVMGASKRLAEMVCQALQQPTGTRFVMVRFGNVLGSTGSVIPKFREQIAKGGPVTVTHPDITRYFMSIPEAVQLVLQAGLMGGGAEIFVLDMGEPVRISDLARDMIRLSGLGEGDIRIVYTGLRPGEKLYEEPLAADENSLPTPHPKLRIAKARQEDGAWLARLSEWLAPDGVPRDETVKTELAQWVPEYSGN
ncbi:MAG: multidrug MFS transporter [Betaproteobacteria bacterium RIFCSPLOWO2_12_FULL_62_58]|nr:MAG: multidrug MFS transporter [Betaproteobacteria bacterium RIFCSPLOWO2_12_FULL_62_58]